MSKKEKKKLLPKLRFPEFRDTGEWESKTLSDVCSMQAGKFVSANEINSEIAENLFPCYGGNGLRGYTKTFTHSGLFSLIGRQGALCGNVIYVTGKFHATEHAVVTTPLKIMDTKWLYYVLKFLKLNQYATGQAQPGLSVSNIERVICVIPKNKKEQQKIADCLTSLDELITAQTEKIELLKNHKKGLMQQLFPKEGENIPLLRFPEFRDAGEWERKKLSNICEINPSKNKLPDVFVYIDLESVTDGILINKNIIKIEDAPIRAQRVLEKDDILFQTVRPYQKNNLYCNFSSDYNYVASTGYAQLRFTGVSLFLYHLIHTDTFVNIVNSKCTGSNYPAINSSDLSSINIKFAKNKKEQQKIADCLTSLDELITAQTEKIELLKKHKKGLMQQLFPAEEENLK